MKKLRLYIRLAVSGIHKNSKLYFPYILTCIGMVMMFYIIHSLSYAPALHGMKGGSNVELILSLGKIVIAVFAVLFLFYTNSFLIHRRYREFGLYNVLGMGKKSLCHVVFWESLIVSALALGAGMGLGIAFSKLAELGLINFVRGEVDYSLTVQGDCVLFTLYLMGTVFVLLTLKSILQVRFSKPMELLRSENYGERPPKANYLLSSVGMIILAVAYSLAVTIRSPLTALILFFVAVIMVIIATYLLFISGSVAMCRLLQRNKKHYYRTEHFISVSSMAYRMKRNGAGLASICILATMVLIMLASTSGLYIGADDAIRTQYPYDINLTIHIKSLSGLRAERFEQLQHDLMSVPDQKGIPASNAIHYCYASFTGLQSDGNINPDSSDIDNGLMLYDGLRQLFFIDVNEYNAIMGTDYAVAPGEAMIGTLHCNYDKSELNSGPLHLKIIGTIEEEFNLTEANNSVIPDIFVLIHDFSELKPLEGLTVQNDYPIMSLTLFSGCNLNASQETILDIFEEQTEILSHHSFLQNENVIEWSINCPIESRNDFYSTFGGLFFLGILLSIIFTAAAVLIIYYKQISEGYEDRSRFFIMQKIGMTREDIQRSINSQILMVFFAPLFMAGLHLIFAFPMVWKLLQLFGLRNIRLVILTSLGSFLVFGMLYAVVYKVTAHTYYNIVSGSGKESFS